MGSAIKKSNMSTSASADTPTEASADAPAEASADAPAEAKSIKSPSKSPPYHSKITGETYPDWWEALKDETQHYNKLAETPTKPGEYYVSPANNQEHEGETVAASMYKFNEKKHAEYGQTITEDLPEENKTQGFFHINYKNKPFESQIKKDSSVDFIEGNIPAMLHSAFAKHYGVVLSPTIMHHCLNFTVSKFIDANSKDMREFLVHHENKKEIKCIINIRELQILNENKDKIHFDQSNPVFSVFDNMTNQLQQAILADIKEPTLIKNLMANYPSATIADKLVNGVQILSAVQEYYAFTCCITCGLPFVMLQGDLSEWALLLNKIKFLRCFFFKCLDATYPKFIEEKWQKTTGKPGSKKSESTKTWGNLVKELGEEKYNKLQKGEVVDLPDFYQKYGLMGMLHDIKSHYHELAYKEGEKTLTRLETETNNEYYDRLRLYVDELENSDEYPAAKYQYDIYRKEIARFENFIPIFHYLAKFKKIVQNMFETKKGESRLDFWNEMFSLSKCMSCGGPPYYENGWLFDLIMNFRKPSSLSEHEIIIESGSDTLDVSMISQIKIKILDSQMNLSAGVFGYQCVNLATEPNKKMWALQPMIGFQYQI